MRAEAEVDGRRQRDGIPLGVDHREVGRPRVLARFGRRPERPVRVARQHRAGLDPARQLGVVPGCGQVGDVHRDEVGVAQVAGAIGERVLERLRQHVQLGGAAPGIGARGRARRIARGEDPQRLDQRDAARR
jgi:hypothetical protein